MIPVIIPIFTSDKGVSLEAWREDTNRWLSLVTLFLLIAFLTLPFYLEPAFFELAANLLPAWDMLMLKSMVIIALIGLGLAYVFMGLFNIFGAEDVQTWEWWGFIGGLILGAVAIPFILAQIDTQFQSQCAELLASTARDQWTPGCGRSN